MLIIRGLLSIEHRARRCVLITIEVATLGVDPGLDRHKVGHKARDGALEQGVVTQDHRLVERMGLIQLPSH